MIIAGLSIVAVSFIPAGTENTGNRETISLLISFFSPPIMCAYYVFSIIKFTVAHNFLSVFNGGIFLGVILRSGQAQIGLL